MGKKEKIYLKLLFSIFLLMQVFSTFAVAKDEDSKLILDTDIEIGKRIYREGILPSGRPMSGFVQGDIPIKGSHLACGNCHRRSGLGSIEGNVITPQITGDILYAPVISRASEFYRLRNPDEKTRPAYTDNSLASAIREGSNPTGRVLDKLMPHYTLSPVDMGYLISYLKTLNSSDSPGVTKTELHLATVMVKDVPQSKKRAMLRVLYEFIKTLNTDTRPRARRAEHAPWHKKWHYESHRTWKLHVWQVEGPEDTWEDQLELLNARDPSFAMVSGIGDGSWGPVHSFCEKNGMPCFFPNINNPPVLSEDNYYSIYFSKGLTLEAEVLAKYFLKSGQSKISGVQKIYQVFPDNISGQTPATVFRKKLSGQKMFEVIDVIPSDIGNIEEANTVVFWMDKKEFLKLDMDKIDLGGSKVFLSASMIDFNKDGGEIKARLKTEPYLIYPYNKPKEMKRKLRASFKWMEKRKIPIVDEQLQANALYSVMLLSRVIKHMGSNFSRDYLIERMEHLDKNIVISPLYPKLTLGPGQRYASTGAYIAKMKEDNSIDIVSDWIVP